MRRQLSLDGLKLNGSARSRLDHQPLFGKGAISLGSVQTEKFRKIGSTFRGGPLFSVGPVRWKLTAPFDLFDSFSIPIPRCSSLSIVHTCVVTTITKLCYAMYVLAVKNGLFPERLSNILSLFESSVRRYLNLTGKNLQSAQNNPLYGMNFYA